MAFIVLCLEINFIQTYIQDTNYLVKDSIYEKNLKCEQ